MKKKFLLLLPVIALMGMAIMVKPVNYTVARAEDGTSEVAFEPKTYVAEEEGETFTLTLLSETEFSLNNGTETLYGSYTRVGNNVTLKYNDQTLEVGVDDNTGRFGEPFTDVVDDVIAQGEENIEKTKNVIKEFKDTFLVPLLSGVSIFSLVTTAISITLAVLNKKSNGQVREKAMEIIEKATDVVNVAKNIKESAQAQYEETKALALEVKGKAQELIESGKKTQEEVKRLYELKNSMVCLLEVEAKKLANEGNAVASGLAEDVNKLVNDLKDLIK